MWPSNEHDLEREQDRLAASRPQPWDPPPSAPLRIGACAIVFERAGRDRVGWAAAAVSQAQHVISRARLVAPIGAPFQPGSLALREGPVLEAVVRRLGIRPDVLLVAAAGRDHPRRAGLALHLGAVLDLPTAGLTDEPLVATGKAPGAAWASRAPLRLGREVVAYALRTRGGAKPVVVHAGWRTSAEVAAGVVLGDCALARWPEALREARRIARALRAIAVA